MELGGLGPSQGYAVDADHDLLDVVGAEAGTLQPVQAVEVSVGRGVQDVERYDEVRVFLNVLDTTVKEVDAVVCPGLDIRPIVGSAPEPVQALPDPRPDRLDHPFASAFPPYGGVQSGYEQLSIPDLVANDYGPDVWQWHFQHDEGESRVHVVAVEGPWVKLVGSDSR